ncbi:MAG TPA: diguanylate cyclase [Gaiellaceae bacterium]
MEATQSRPSGSSARAALGWLALALAVGVIAGAVLIAAHAQETTAETNFGEAQIASDMRIAILEQERGLDGYVLDRKASELSAYFAGKQALASDLIRARAQSDDDAIETALVVRQRTILTQWLATSSLELVAAQRHTATVGKVDVRSDRLISSFLDVNDRYRDRLAVRRHSEASAAALVPVWLICGLSALFGAGGWLLLRRRRRMRGSVELAADAARNAELALTASQNQFAEAMQVSDSQDEAHEVIVRHLEATIPGSEVLVLNRNNSADRLESTRALPADHALAEPLAESRPRSCLAVRLSRRFDRGDGTGEVLACEVCGVLQQASSCQPLLVGGQVIGSVLVTHEGPLAAEGTRRLVDSVSLAAPVLANLRNLAIAEDRAATDALTGLPNRRSVDDTLKRLIAQSARSGQPLSVALLDVDHFKQINDNFGHDRGDEALAAVGALLQSELRSSDFAGRTGGEEFVLMLPDTDLEGATLLADKIRLGFHTLRVPGVARDLSASFGIATFPHHAGDVATLLRVADRALYSAKRLGRDRVEVVPVEPLDRLKLDDVPLAG